MSKAMKVLLTGASGGVGRKIIDYFLNDGNKVELVLFDVKTKRNQKKLKAYKNRFEIIWGDLSAYNDVEKACRGIDAVIHTAAIIPPLADHNPLLANKVNVEGTQNLVKALKANCPQAYIIYTSSVSVYGDRIDNPWIKVGDDLCPSDRDNYAVTKLEAEKVIIKSQLNWTIVRLSAVFGFENEHKFDPITFHMPLDTKMEFVTYGDVARALGKAIGKQEQLVNRIFNLGGGESCRIKSEDFMKFQFAAIGLKNIEFPAKLFADKNFHCGYYEDGDELEEILKFRSFTLELFKKGIRDSVNPIQRLLTESVAFLIKPLVIRYFKRISEPYQAYVSNNKVDNKHYFRG